MTYKYLATQMVCVHRFVFNIYYIFHSYCCDVLVNSLDYVVKCKL